MTETNVTLAARAAGLMSKASAYGVVEKAMAQALAAKRVYPAMAQDFSEQLGHDLPLKTRDFVRVVVGSGFHQADARLRRPFFQFERAVADRRGVLRPGVVPGSLLGPRLLPFRRTAEPDQGGFPGR